MITSLWRDTIARRGVVRKQARMCACVPIAEVRDADAPEMPME
jgi:hypothetical protein